MKNRVKKLRDVANILNKERKLFPTVARSSVVEVIVEAERLANLCEQSATCVGDRRDRAKHLATLHAWYVLMDIREMFWANACKDSKGGANVISNNYWSAGRLNRLPALKQGDLWHVLSGIFYNGADDGVNFEYLQNLHEPLRKAGRGLQSFWNRKGIGGTISQN